MSSKIYEIHLRNLSFIQRKELCSFLDECPHAVTVKDARQHLLISKWTAAALMLTVTVLLFAVGPAAPLFGYPEMFHYATGLTLLLWLILMTDIPAGVWLVNRRWCMLLPAFQSNKYIVVCGDQ